MAFIGVPKSIDSEGKTSKKIILEFEDEKKNASGRVAEKLIELSQEREIITLSGMIVWSVEEN